MIFALVFGFWTIVGLITVALVSLASRDIQQRGLDMGEIVVVLLFWPFFLVALLIRLNS